jgi:hypothetical protein
MVRLLPKIGPKKKEQPAEQPTEAPAARKPGFRERGRMRRRLRYLRKARELAYRDLGGLTFTLYRFGGRREELMAAKLERLATIDRELRALEKALGAEQPYTVLREAGVVACPRCAEIHSSEDRFCPSCGLERSPDAELPLTTAQAGQSQGGEGTPTPAPTSGEPQQSVEETRQLSELELGGRAERPNPEETQVIRAEGDRES